MKAREMIKSIPVILFSTIAFSILLSKWIGYLYGAILGFVGATTYVVIKHVLLKIPYKEGDKK